MTRRLRREDEAAVDRFLTAPAAGIRFVMLEGRISMPEVIDRVRREVPEAAKPRQRSRIANLFPKPPTSVTIGIGDAELKTSGVTAKAGREAPSGGRSRTGRRAAPRPRDSPRAAPRRAPRASSSPMPE